ncbi:MAG: hypothetical protein R2911_45925 [Caldilineaceae bacterium]
MICDPADYDAVAEAVASGGADDALRMEAGA